MPSVQTMQEETEPAAATTSVTRQAKRGAAFYLLFVALCVSLFLASFEISAVTIALPSIASDLNSSDFSWVGAGYSLASSAAMPLTGGLCEAFGRRAIMLLALVIFAVGSTICGAAQSMNMLIAGRFIQGVGGGGILSLPSIVLSDMVSLQERGLYNGLLGVTYSIALATSAVIGGALANEGNTWRWIFYLNLPIVAVALVLVLVFMRTPVPPGSLLVKLKAIDWIGTLIVITSTSLVCVALTWAGTEHSWASAAVLAPLLIGLAGLIFFVLFDAKVAKEPLIPFQLLNNRTTIIGYIDTFLTAVLGTTTMFFLPGYLQASMLDSPIRAGGVHFLGISLPVGPMGIIAGISVKIFKVYRPQIWISWAFAIVGAGLITLLGPESTTAQINGYEFVGAAAVGMLYTTTYFPVLAPLPVSANARALAFFNFCRAFGQVWGIAIGATILQNELLNRLPTDFTKTLPEGMQVAYAVIPQIKDLAEPLQMQVRVAFDESIRAIWYALLGFGGAGFLVSLFMKEVPMPTVVDEKWAVNDRQQTAREASADIEEVPLPKDSPVKVEKL